jgi:hypothetical protein
MDPEKGYYNTIDDSITLEVWLNADAPVNAEDGTN